MRLEMKTNPYIVFCVDEYLALATKCCILQEVSNNLQ